VETSKPQSGAPWPHAVSLVLAADTPQQRDWSVSVAIGIARKLAGQRKVVLVDAAVSGPSVTEKLAVDQAGGIVDVLFRGASFATVAQRPTSETFFFLPLGPDAPPPEVLFQHPRWIKIAERLADAAAHLLVCVSETDWFASGPISGFEACIILNGSGRSIELPRKAHRFAEFLAPPAIRETTTSIESNDEAGEAAPAGDTLEPAASKIVETPGPERESVGSAAGRSIPPLPTAPPADLTPGVLGVSQSKHGRSASIREKWARRRSGMTVPQLGPLGRRIAGGAVLVIAVVVVAVVWTAFDTGGGPEEINVFQAAAETTAVADRVAPPPREEKPTGGRPVGTRLPYSVAIASYSSFEDALARQKKLTRNDLPVYVAPTPVRGVVYYRVFAGLVAERSEAEALMARLVRDGVKDTVSSWDVRQAQYAFSFGSFASAREAKEQVEALLNQGIQAYTVPVQAGAGAGEVVYHVYAGGYETREAAEPLREQIEAAGLSAELIERVGLLER
jgi:cell division septation protein DedD